MEPQNKFDYVLKLYEIAHQSQQYEGDGVWNRFNVLLTINTFFVGFLTFTYEQISFWLSVVIALSGVVINLLGLRSMYRLWKWHELQQKELE